jgi:hypothetical protein
MDERHASGQMLEEVMVGIDEPRENDSPRQLNDLSVGKVDLTCWADGADASVLDDDRCIIEHAIGVIAGADV